MSHTRRVTLFALALIVTMLAAGALFVAMGGSGPSTPKDTIIDAIKLAREQDGYHVVTDIEQTVIPKAMPTSLGKGGQTNAMRVLGDVSIGTRLDGGDDTRAHLQFYAAPGESPIEMLMAGDKVYVGYQGQWKQAQDPLGGLVPGGDYLSFLDAVRDVVELEPATTATGVYRHFSFTIDSELYAEYQRQRMQYLLAGRIPQGVELQASPTLLNMGGEGELWIDAQGLPHRQIIHLDMPGVTDRYDANANLIIDFSRFGDPITPIEMPQATGSNGALVLPKSQQTLADATSLEPGVIDGNPATSRFQPLTSGLDSLRSILDGLSPRLLLILLVLPFLALAVLVVLYRRNRKIYIIIATAIIAVMVIQPLAQAAQFTSFNNFSNSSAPLEDALSELGALPDSAANHQALAGALAQLAPRSTTATDLKDCRSMYVDAGSQPGGDDDADGLTNEVEWCIGTDYTDYDSDGDFITDTVELNGFDFTYTDTNGHQTVRHFTSDPLDPDSNGDGVADNNEWDPTLTDDYHCTMGSSTNTSFTDKDCDGLPNLWDDDNDGDGVPDDQDVSPYQVMPYRPSFTLNLSHQNTVTRYRLR